ncbi:hypothetical protein EN788_40445, partial [Mesorhizobium sp. M2D.F.Ca.ET.145.01.1.1]
AGAPSLRESLAAGKRLRLAKVDNFVDGAAVAEIGDVEAPALLDLVPGAAIVWARQKAELHPRT